MKKKLPIEAQPGKQTFAPPVQRSLLHRKYMYTKHLVKSCILKITYYLFYFCKLDYKKVVFTNYYGLSGYTDSLKCICDEFLKRNKGYKIYWILKYPDMPLPEGCIGLRRNRLKSYYHLATAGTWINSQRINFCLFKKKDQLYIQTWHGCLGFKKIEIDAIDSYKHKKEYLMERLRDNKMMDYFVSGAYWFNNIIRTAFKFDGSIINYGLPRNDVFFNKENIDIESLKKEMNLPEDKKIVLYAPTFRNDEYDLSVLNMDYNKILETLEATTNEKWILVIRLHPRQQKLSELITYNDKLINGSIIPDMKQLLLVSDMLISDYSSCVFDFTFQNRPAFLYTPDLDDYKNDRDFYIDIENLPFPLARTNEELLQKISSFDKEKYLSELQSFYSTVGLTETGHSTEKIVDMIEYFSETKSKDKLKEYISKDFENNK